MNICVFGSASEDIGEQYKKDTEAICKALAKCGNNLVFGGGGTGLMGAAARGFAAGGGNIYGFIPTFIVDKDVEPPFDKCTSLVETKTMHERYLNLRNRYRKLNTEGPELDSVYNNMQLARNLRDSLGALIGQSWLGEDY